MEEINVARKKFAEHFLTFWHLTYVASFGLGANSKFRAASAMTREAGNIWTKHFSGREYSRFDHGFNEGFKFIEDKLPKLNPAQAAEVAESTESAKAVEAAEFSCVEERALTLIANYKKCLNVVKNFDSQMKDDLNPLSICSILSSHFSFHVDDFLGAPILWTSLITNRLHQLFLLAKECLVYDQDSLNNLEQIILEHGQFIQHLQTNANSIGTSSKYLEPVISQDQLVGIFNENTTTAAKQIPTALTGIIRDYCCSDPFNLSDMDIITANVVKIN